MAALVGHGRHAAEALDALYERHAPAVYGYLTRRLGIDVHSDERGAPASGAIAEDALAAAFARLWARPSIAPRDTERLVRWLLMHAEQAATSLGAPPATARAVCLEDVLITPELSRRPSRAPDLNAENEAFFRIARRLATHASPNDILQTLVDAAVDLCGAGTAGLSLLETPEDGGEPVFRWTHMAGALAKAVGESTPRGFSPCGVTLDRGAPQLFREPGRYFEYLAAAPSPIVEGLVIPLASSGEADATALGTIWIVSHDPASRPFDWEDARIMTSLASFTSIALQIADANVEKAGREALRDRERLSAREIEALAAEREAILDQLADGVVVADSEGRLVLVNEASRRLHGVSALGVSVTAYAETYHLYTMEGQPYPSNELPLARAVLHGETVERERWRIKRPDGSEIVAEGSAAPVVLADGTRYGSVLVVRDVSDQVETDRQKDAFLASVSHDLKNPLSTIRGTAQLLLRQVRRGTSPSPVEVSTALEAIESASTHMADQLTMALDETRTRMGRSLDLVRRPTDLVRLTRQLVDEYQRTTVKHRLALSAPEELMGQWDNQRLRRAFRNLLGNALAYSPAGGDVTVSIGVEDGDAEEGPLACVAIVDHGLGIPAADLPFVFERFRRGQNVAGRIEGSGIGLADVRDVAEQHGGSVSIESKEGEGCTVTVRLPLIHRSD